MSGAIGRGRILAGAVAMSLFLLSANADGAVRKVPQQYPTIQAAVDAANPGDKIEVSKKKNFENVTVLTPRLVIKGVKPGVVVDGYLELGGHGRQFDINANRVRIANLEVRHGFGIDCNSYDRCVASKVRFTGQSQDDCFYSSGDRAQVLRSTLNACGDSGVDITGDKSRVIGSTIRLTDSECIDIDGDDAIVRGNKVRSCEDGDGIDISGKGARVEGNRIANVDGDLVYVSGDNAKVLRNRASGAYGDCYYVSGNRARVQGNVGSNCEDGGYASGQQPKVIGNRFSSLEDTGITISCSVACSKAVARDNVVRGALDDAYGVYASIALGTGSALIQGNVVVDAADRAYYLSLYDGRILGNTARSSGYEQEPAFYVLGSDNTLKRNKAVSGGGDGFQVSGDENLLEGNTARKNHGDGIEVDNYLGNRLIGNVATGNRADGIENRGLNTVLRRNRASGNRRDCANDGTIAVKKQNRCADKSNFNKPGTARQSKR